MEFDKDAQQKLMQELADEVAELEQKPVFETPKWWPTKWFRRNEPPPPPIDQQQPSATAVAGDSQQIYQEALQHARADMVSGKAPPMPPTGEKKVTQTATSTTISEGNVTRTISRVTETPLESTMKKNGVWDSSAAATTSAKTGASMPQDVAGLGYAARHTDGQYAKWKQASTQHTKKQRIPISARWWFPWFCFAGIILIWIPDNKKIWFLYWLDWKHELLKDKMHRWYWRMTMEPDKYSALLKEMDAKVPKQMREIKTTKCPL